jgi:hypothetical protein
MRPLRRSSEAFAFARSRAARRFVLRALAALPLLAFGGQPAHAVQAPAISRPPSALDLLAARRPEVATHLDAAIRAVLSLVSPEQARALLRGDEHLSGLRLASGIPLSEFLDSVLGSGTYAVPFYSLDAGGGASSGGEFQLLGTIGQPDAAVVSDAATGYTLVGGLRGRLTDFALFRDGFESGDSSRWSATIP